jgi:arylsulfatase A
MINKFVGLGICSGLLLSASGPEPENIGNKKPNIIIILADDLGYGDLGGYFGGNAKTPNLNRLAQEGMIFTDFHTNGPMCSPTRASLLTGRYSQRLGIETAARNVLDLPENQDEITFAHYLGETGYSTGIIGKWHLGRPENGNPVNFGFEKFIGFHGGCRVPSIAWWQARFLLYLFLIRQL